MGGTEMSNAPLTSNPEVPDVEFLLKLSDQQHDLAIANRLLAVADNMHRMWLKLKIPSDPDDDPSAGGRRPDETDAPMTATEIIQRMKDYTRACAHPVGSYICPTCGVHVTSENGTAEQT